MLIWGGGVDKTIDIGISKDITSQQYSILIPSAMRVERQSRTKDPNEGGLAIFPHILSACPTGGHERGFQLGLEGVFLTRFLFFRSKFQVTQSDPVRSR